MRDITGPANPIDERKKWTVQRRLYAMAAVTTTLAIARVVGILPNVGPSTELLSGLCAGSWVSVAAFHLTAKRRHV
jgi:hypothetical protein